MDTTPHPFAQLSPARVVAAVESLGFWLPGEPFTLNSYENRVFLVHEASPLGGQVLPPRALDGCPDPRGA